MSGPNGSQAEKLKIKLNNFQTGLRLTVLQFRNRIIGSLYVKEVLSSGVNLQTIINKIIELINEQIRNVVIIDSNYVCRVKPRDVESVREALENAPRGVRGGRDNESNQRASKLS